MVISYVIVDVTISRRSFVFETSVTVNNNSPIQDYVHPGGKRQIQVEKLSKWKISK